MGGAKKFYITKRILDDLCTKFIINVPIDERLDIVKFCAYVEQAHWHCADVYQINISFRLFARVLFRHVPFLSQHADNAYEIADKYKL